MKRSGPLRRPGDPATGEAEGPRTKFAVDAMHGSLARKLRAFGFDSFYYRQGDDEGIIDLASTEGRVVVTSDRSLVARATARKVPAILLEGRSDGSRLGEISRGAAGLGVALRKGDPLCSLCGGELSSLARKDASRRVPPSVWSRHRVFFLCTRCGQVYWRGGHWKKLRSLARRLVNRRATSDRSGDGRGQARARVHRSQGVREEGRHHPAD